MWAEEDTGVYLPRFPSNTPITPSISDVGQKPTHENVGKTHVSETLENTSKNSELARKPQPKGSKSPDPDAPHRESGLASQLEVSSEEGVMPTPNGMWEGVECIRPVEEGEESTKVISPSVLREKRTEAYRYRMRRMIQGVSDTKMRAYNSRDYVTYDILAKQEAYLVAKLSGVGATTDKRRSSLGEASRAHAEHFRVSRATGSGHGSHSHGHGGAVRPRYPVTGPWRVVIGVWVFVVIALAALIDKCM